MQLKKLKNSSIYNFLLMHTPHLCINKMHISQIFYTENTAQECAPNETAYLNNMTMTEMCTRTLQSLYLLDKMEQCS